MLALLRVDATPNEITAGIYKLGVMIGGKGEKNRIQIPYDILEFIADNYSLNIDDLTKPFMNGFLEGLKERNKDEKEKEPVV